MLTVQETARIRAAIRRANYCITRKTMERYCKQHKHARETDDTHTMEKIEYHLTYINFHSECSMLMLGEYDKLAEALKNW